MRLSKHLKTCSLVVFSLAASALVTNAQNCSIEVKTKTEYSKDGRSASIQFEIDGQTGSKDYSIYCLTAIRKNDSPVPAYQFTDLRAGTYEFVVVDKTKSKCAKEIQVKIEEP